MDHAFYFVIPEGPGLTARGKGTRPMIRGICRWLERYGVQSGHLTVQALLDQGPPKQKNPRALLLYNEARFISERAVDTLRRVEAQLKNAGYALHHTADVGEILGDKERLNHALRPAGVPLPEIAKDASGASAIFSNAAVGSHVETQVIAPGGVLDANRYNTRLINTNHHSCGTDYYVSLRTHSFGKRVYRSWVRTRPVSEGDPSVHSGDTAPDADVQRDLHQRLVIPNQKAIQDISDQVASVLGPQIYAHDLLPCAETGQLLMCETGFKIYDDRYRIQMEPIHDAHPVAEMFTNRRFCSEAAKLIATEFIGIKV